MTPTGQGSGVGGSTPATTDRFLPLRCICLGVSTVIAAWVALKAAVD